MLRALALLRNSAKVTSVLVSLQSSAKVLEPIQHDVEIDAADIDNTTAFTCVARCGKRVAVLFLHDRGISAFVADRKRRMPQRTRGYGAFST